jgi:hypothetical protein
MKLKNLIPQRFRRRLVRQFGQAKLVKLPNGQHELIGGTDADRAAAFEWTSIVDHEIVSTHFLREKKSRCSPRKTWFALPFQPAV